MTPTLRQTHRVIWILLAVLLPIGFVAALRLNTRPPVQEPPIGAPLAGPLPELVKSIQKQGLQVSLRRSEQPTVYQLEIIVRQPLEVPSGVVRLGDDANGPAVGTLDVAGIYRFQLPDTTRHPTITLVDDVHHTPLQTIHF